MKQSLFILPVALTAVGCGSSTAKKAAADTTEAKKPNVIVILADDLGYGDVSAYGSTTISTPNIDRLANEGVCFNNGYATSATSTPSRYALMTGLYPWKNDDAKILAGDAPLLVSTEIETLPKMMQANGYATAAIGKWHLGMGNGNIDWNKQITPCGNDIGFDYTNLIAATNDRVPSVFVENGLVVGLDPNDPIEVSYEKNFEGEPTALTNPEMLRMKWHHGHNNSIVNGIPRIGFMKGGEKARWRDEDMADYFLGLVKNFITEKKDEPFFLYYGLHQPHVPRTPHERFAGSTTMGPRGDAIVEGDWCIGQLLDFLEEQGLLENTLIVFSSDNGPVLNDGYYDDSDTKIGNHKPAGGLRGGKYSLFDGATHVPFFAYWKGHIEPTKSDAMVCHIDLYASIASLIGAEVPAGLDSQDLLPAFLGESQKGRDELVVEASGRMALRSGDYTMIPPYKGSVSNETGNELGNLPDFALFNVDKDAAQTTDISATQPEKLNELKARFLELTKGYYDPQIGEEKLQ